MHCGSILNISDCKINVQYNYSILQDNILALQSLWTFSPLSCIYKSLFVFFCVPDTSVSRSGGYSGSSGWPDTGSSGNRHTYLLVYIHLLFSFLYCSFHSLIEVLKSDIKIRLYNYVWYYYNYYNITHTHAHLGQWLSESQRYDLFAARIDGIARAC